MERFELPEDLSELSGEDLDSLKSKATERLEALRGVSRPSADDVAELNSIKEFRSTLKAQEEAAAEFAATLAEVPDEPVVAEPEPQPEPEPAPPVEAAAETVQEEPPVELASEPAPAQEEESAEEVETVMAAASKPVPDVAVPEGIQTPKLTIVAAADIPQVPMGSEMDFAGMAKATFNKARVLGNSTQRHPVATIEKIIPDEYDLRGMNDYQIANHLDEVANVSNYEKSLTASGGWCAPSEILYDLFETICPNPLQFRLPTFRADRGGVRWPIYEALDFAATYDWVWTETDDIAATGTKPCITVPCPTFDECRLEAHGVCVEVGNFIDRAYPEQVAWYLRRVFFHHARAETLSKIAAVVADTDSATIAATFGTASALASGLLLQVQAYRDRNGLCAGQLIEAWAPVWLREAIRADLARQDFHGIGNGLVTDAQINAWFADSGVSVNWVNYWQALEAAAPGPVVWPGTVDVLLYTPGAYVQFDGGTLDLGVTRDSVLNATNDFNIFTEEFYCIGRRGPRGVVVTFNICPDGKVGFREDVACPIG